MCERESHKAGASDDTVVFQIVTEVECLEDADARERARARRAEWDKVIDERYRAEFAAHVRAQYPACPERDSVAIAEHACRKYSGRVGRSAEAKRFDPEAIKLAVRAHVRHVPYGVRQIAERRRGSAHGAWRSQERR